MDNGIVLALESEYLADDSIPMIWELQIVVEGFFTPIIHGTWMPMYVLDVESLITH